MPADDFGIIDAECFFTKEGKFCEIDLDCRVAGWCGDFEFGDLCEPFGGAFGGGDDFGGVCGGWVAVEIFNDARACPI